MPIVIHTVSSVDILPHELVEPCTIGSWTSRTAAIRGCADYIVERCILRNDIRYAIVHDINHEGIISEIAEGSDMPTNVVESLFAYKNVDGWKIPPTVKSALRDYLENAIALNGMYVIETGIESDIGVTEFHFDVSSNGLVVDKRFKIERRRKRA